MSFFRGLLSRDDHHSSSNNHNNNSRKCYQRACGLRVGKKFLAFGDLPSGILWNDVVLKLFYSIGDFSEDDFSMRYDPNQNAFFFSFSHSSSSSSFKVRIVYPLSSRISRSSRALSPSQ